MSNDVLCSGTLISNQHILIAAHCLWPKPYFKGLKVISNVYVTIGNENYDLMEIKIHSDWKFNKDNYDADIAVVSLFRPINVTPAVMPACLPPSSTGPIIVPGGVVDGMNTVEKSKVRERVALEKNSDCFQHFPSNIQNASPRTFCANWQGQEITLAKEFSGSYLFPKDTTWYIQGIESESFVQKNQCDIKKHSVFTNVASYADWVHNIIKRDLERPWKDVELKCTFVKNYEGLYGCEVENFVGSSPNVRIASITGNHADRMTHNDVEYVWIKNGRVSHLPRFDAGIFFPNLKKFLVTESGLKFVERDDFTGMPKLETLDLSGNELEELPEDLLYDSSELIDLFIDNNKLKTVPENLLNNSHNFQRFKASNNLLEVLGPNLFKNTPSLKILTLDNNRLQKIGINFTQFRNLKKVDLLNNSCVSTNYNDWRKYKSLAIIQKEVESGCR